MCGREFQCVSMLFWPVGTVGTEQNVENSKCWIFVFGLVYFSFTNCYSQQWKVVFLTLASTLHTILLHTTFFCVLNAYKYKLRMVIWLQTVNKVTISLLVWFPSTSSWVRSLSINWFESFNLLKHTLSTTTMELCKMWISWVQVYCKTSAR